MAPPQPETQSVLLNIYERLGAIESKLEAMVKSHDTMDKDIDGLREFRQKVGAYLWLGSSLVSGVLLFLLEGAKYALDKILNHSAG